jgi:ferric-dicitrate binding protein FerR (iron transport regulator)
MEDLFMNNNQSEIESLVIGFFTHSLNDNELEQLWRWLDEDESHRKEFDGLRSAWIMSGYEAGKQHFDAGQSWSSVEQRIKTKKLNLFGQLKPLWYAASLVISFGLGAWGFYFVSQNRQVQTQTQVLTQTQTQAQPPPEKTATTTTVITVPLGSKSSVTLPDGSLVWLNAGSEMCYSSEYGNENRDIQLNGEAFFDVVSDSLKPFSVITPGMTVMAYGTRFNVKAYPDDPTSAATLEEGKIDVVIKSVSDSEQSPQSIRLSPKEQIVVYKTVKPVSGKGHIKVREPALAETLIKDVVIKSSVQTELSTSWKDSKWIINDEPLSVFAGNLERRYNIHIRFSSEELKEYNFSGIIENETIEQILNALSLAAPVKYKVNKNNVVLSLNAADKAKFSKILKNNK